VNWVKKVSAKKPFFCLQLALFASYTPICCNKKKVSGFIAEKEKTSKKKNIYLMPSIDYQLDNKIKIF